MMINRVFLWSDWGCKNNTPQLLKFTYIYILQLSISSQFQSHHFFSTNGHINTKASEHLII